jgi:exodeoxyribonuclease VII large subunit
MALDTSPEHPAPVRTIATLIVSWVNRLGSVWIEGQVAQVTRRPGTATVFLTLRDPVADLSLSATCARVVFDSVDPPVVDGALVVVHARPRVHPARGSLQLSIDDIRPVGIGALLAAVERRRQQLAAEGLFAAARKRPLPFLPGLVGLICGRDSAAERDVLDNAARRWPAVRFSVRQVPVQGPSAAAEVTEALRRLAADPEVAVIVIARGGGSVEDLLPFSDEALLRAVADCRVPVVSAIGHETDTPLLDLVADVRASTPTDAARRVVPDVGEEHERIAAARERTRRAVRGHLDRETTRLATVRSRPVLADPVAALVTRAAAAVADSRRRTGLAMAHRVDRQADLVTHVTAQLRTLSPQATLDRGYAVLTRDGGQVVRAPRAVTPGERLTARLAEGSVAVEVLPGSGRAQP